jgi:glycerol-3-phosphate O-acyltransferase
VSLSGSAVTLPLWLAALLVLLAAWAALDRLLLPGVRWFVRQRANRVLAEVRARFAIEIRPFQLTRRRVLVDRLVWDARVVAAAQEHAREEGMPREVAMARVERYAREIVPAFNAYLYFRIGYWLARRTAQLLYRVRLGWADDEGLAAVPEGASVVFVINHRSNMDYVLVAYLAATRTALSYAVGEWARIWPLDALLRSMGAYFVRRRSRDALYRRVLERYVQMATEAGVPQAIFPEGGLSRDGRLGPPRLGLLDYMLRELDPAAGRDVLFVPVAVNYDRTLEDRTLLRDLEPAAPRRGPLAAAATTAGFLARQLGLLVTGRWYRFGYACVNFGTPISARRWLAERGLDLRSLPREERFAAIGELGAELMAAVGRVVPVVPVALVAAAFERRRGAAITAVELEREVVRLRAALDAAGAHVYLPRDDPGYALRVGLRMLRLRRIVGLRDGLLRVEAGEERLLAYYAGSIAHLLREAAVEGREPGDRRAAAS